MSDEAGVPLGRRAFLRALPALPAGLGAGVAFVSSACAGASWLVPLEITPGRLVVPLVAIQEAGAFVAHPRSNRPIYVARRAGGELIALHAQCTHQGCQPEPVADRMVCPCHGSEFALDGSVLQGPAERPLTRFPAAVEGSEVVIRIDGGGE
jgi:cytochrome b6-f complex iron-sulfur subunit